MAKRFEIIEEEGKYIFINDAGNLETKIFNDIYCLRDEENNIVSHQYYCMINLGSDHFAVCNARNEIKYNAFPIEYAIILKEFELKSKAQWGIIRVNRDENGEVIPQAETLIIPYVYDRISSNNLKTATAYSNGKLTYIDIDINSENYGQQLVPCLLEHAVPFSEKYEGFAECSINGITGYLPRNCQARRYIEGSELLTGKQVRLIKQYLKLPNKFALDYETMSIYFNLTGIRLPKEKGPVLTKKKITDPYEIIKNNRPCQ